ncbi:MAG: diguanylate cyclase [Pseudomonadota bacterium]
MESSSIENGYSSQLYAEEVKLLYKNAPLAYSVTIINGAILAFVQSAYISASILFSWSGCLVFVTAIRVLIVWRYAKATPGPERAVFWNYLYLTGAGLAGMVWGAAAIVLFPIESVAHQLFVAFVLAGMSAAGMAVLASRLEACFVFLLLTLLPLIYRYFTHHTMLQTAMGVMTVMFLIGMFVSGWNFHRAIRMSLNLRFDKRELLIEVEQRRRVEESLFREKDRLQTTLSSIGEGVVLIDANGCIEYLNPAAERLCGWRFHSALNRSVSEVFASFDQYGQRTTMAMEDSLRLAAQVTKQNVLHHDGKIKYPIEELASVLYDRHGKVVGAVSVFRDVTEVLQKFEQLTYAADHDTLTGLPNRNLLKDRTKQAIARAQRKHENFALLFLDLDCFKMINDSMGHAAGDKLLIDVAKRLVSSVREEDTIARLGGDEFVVLLDGPSQENQVEIVADKILSALRKPFRLGAQTVIITASIGCSWYPNDGNDAETLLVHADVAMYRAKQQGRDRMSM